MSSSILHQCPYCGHVSDISHTLAAFVENPHCSQCGLCASESHQKMQDELAALFSRQMSMEPVHIRSVDKAPSQPPMSYSITQHYHHSSHVAFQSRPSPMEEGSSIDDILRHHGLDPRNFSPSQLDLFKHANPEQRERLVQTWQLYAELGQEGVDFEMNDRVEATRDDGMQYAEPYMVSGYESQTGEHGSTPLPNEPTTGAPYSPSSDPVYQGFQSQTLDEMNRYPGCGVAQPYWLRQ